MYSVPGDTTSLAPGFPIRTSSDPRSVGSSPRHIAASHVLHRLPVPRHPPCALKHLQHKTKKMSHHPHTPHKGCMRVSEKFALHAEHRKAHKDPPRSDARNHYPQIKHHTPPPKQGNNQPSQPPPTTGETEKKRAVVSKPNSVSGDPSKRCFPTTSQRLLCTKPPPTTGKGFLTAR